MEDAALDEIFARLKLKPGKVATTEQVRALEELVGAPLPSAFRALLVKYGPPAGSDLQRAATTVLFSSVDEITQRVRAFEIEGQGAVPFALDLFGSVYILILKTDEGHATERVMLMPVREEYADADVPVEQIAASFAAFLELLTPAS